MSFFRSLFQAYNGSDYGKEKKRSRPFRELDGFPMLHSSNYLNNLITQAETDDELDLILEHLYKFDTLDIESYKNVEQKIIDRRWKE